MTDEEMWNYIFNFPEYKLKEMDEQLKNTDILPHLRIFEEVLLRQIERNK